MSNKEKKDEIYNLIFPYKFNILGEMSGRYHTTLEGALRDFLGVNPITHAVGPTGATTDTTHANDDTQS